MAVMLLKVVVVLIVTGGVHGQLDRKILLNGGDCGRTTQVPGGVVVSHDPIDLVIPISNDISCLFTIRTFRPRQTVRLVFDHLTLEPNDCSRANIEIYDDSSDTDSSQLLLPIICPGDDPSTLEYFSTTNWLTMKITANNLVPPDGNLLVNFSASYASFTAKPCQRPDLETECTTVDRCIYNELLCDGVDACGDNTDESEEPPANCEPSATDSPSGSSGAVNSALIAILVLAAACLVTYVIYILMSFAWFSEKALSCLRACIQYALTRRKKRQPADKEKIDNVDGTATEN